jgi:hypothetical protein
LNSDHLPILFHVLDHVSARNYSASLEIHTDWEQFRTYGLISPTIKIDVADDAEKADCNSAASIASAYRLTTGKITLSELNNELPAIDRLLQLKQRLRNLGMKSGMQHVKQQLTGSPRLFV